MKPKYILSLSLAQNLSDIKPKNKKVFEKPNDFRTTEL